MPSTTVWRIFKVELKKKIAYIQMKQKQNVDNKKQRLKFSAQFSTKVKKES